MEAKYNLNLSPAAVTENLNRILNQIYKLLPMREEGEDWTKPLETIIEELAGLYELLNKQEVLFIQIISKMEGLLLLKEEKKFFLFRRLIFECLNLMGELVNSCQ